VLPHVLPVREVRFDWRGFGLSAAACMGVVFGASVVSLPVLPPQLGVALFAVGAGFWALYLRHARRTAEPLLRLSLMRSDAFRAVMVSGFAFRIGVGALPFLLPLMLQLGFGFTPLESGLVSCAAIAGALGMKALVKGVLRRFGFRTTLIAAALLGGALIAPMGFWRPDATIFYLVGLLAAGGLSRSLFFTSINALAFADVPPERTGDATALLSAGQQVSIALGVALAGAILETLLSIDGRTELLPQDFTIAFLIVGAVSMLAALAFLNMGRGAGTQISGHRMAAE
jgi:Na+/melibiose symporter-like transporter